MITLASHEQVVDWLDARVRPLPGEPAPAAGAVGRVLAQPVAAPADYPAVPAAAVDGFALSAEATVGASDYNPLPFRVAGEGEAVLRGGEAGAVVSGQALPGGADAVVFVDDADRRGEVVHIHAPVAPGANVIPAGREARDGEPLLAAGRALRPADLALLVGLGIANVAVTRRPRVGILVVRGDVRDAGGAMIRALVERDGAVAGGPFQPDSSDLAETLAARDDDLLLVIGGSGPGANDHAAAALGDAGEVVFRGVALNPGETTILGSIRDRPVVVLPGPPLGALFAYDMIAGRAVRTLAGRRGGLPYGRRRAVLDRKIASALGRLECCRVRVCADAAEPFAVADNRTLSSAVRADGFVLVPEHSEGFVRGSEVEVYMYDESCLAPRERPGSGDANG